MMPPTTRELFSPSGLVYQVQQALDHDIQNPETPALAPSPLRAPKGQAHALDVGAKAASTHRRGRLRIDNPRTLQDRAPPSMASLLGIALFGGHHGRQIINQRPIPLASPLALTRG